MEHERATELQRRNPRADPKVVGEALEMYRKAAELDIESPAVFTTPPSDPYSTADTGRRIRARKKPPQNA